MAQNTGSILTDDSLDFLERYLNNASPTGYESAGQKLWMDYLKPYVDTFMTDAYGSAVGVINPDAEYKVVIEGHADEIGWYVRHITDDGFISVARNGGSDHQIAPSKRVHVHTAKGVVDGVFGWPAIHTRDPSKEKAPTKNNIFVDVGATSREGVEELGVHVGCVITYPDQFWTLNGDKFVCRAIDNRMGGFMIAEVARRIHESGKKPDFGLYVVNAVQEEVGLKGAGMIAERIKPDVAICTDVTHDTSTPMIEAKEIGAVKMGDGPVITYAPAVQNRVREHLIATAQKKEIPFQRLVSAPATGTDTDAFAYSNAGVPSALIALPLRYMHTTVEMVHRSDVENVIRLIQESVATLSTGETFSYFD